MAAGIGLTVLERPNSSTGRIRYGKEVKAPGGFARGPGWDLARLTRPLATSLDSSGNVSADIFNDCVLCGFVIQGDNLQLERVISAYCISTNVRRLDKNILVKYLLVKYNC